MDIQSIYAGNKTNPAAATTSDEDAAPASGFAALLDLVSTQFKATLGIGMDPVAIKTDAPVEAPRAPEPRDAKPRPERSDDRDAKAKPTQNEGEEGEEQTDETTATGEQTSDTADTGTQSAQQQAAQAAVAAVVDAALVAQTVAAAPVIVAEAVVKTAVETTVATAETAVIEVAAADTTLKATESVVDVKAAVQTEVKAAERNVAAEAVVKNASRVQQAIGANAPAQAVDDVETVAVEVETATAETKTAAKDSAVRTLDVRSAAAQEQANSLARLLGSENRIQVQVSTNAAHAAKQAVADVSVYNIYAGYTAVDAISLANGQFGQADNGQAPTQSPAPRATEGLSQAAAIAPAPQVPGTIAPNISSAGNAGVGRADGLSAVAVQASASTGATGGGASSANMNFSAFTQSGQSSATQQSQAPAQPNPAERPAATAQHVIDQIKVNITKAAKAGLDRVTIQLKPVELGRIEIKLEMSEDHKVRVTVTVDSKDTLGLLQTDARTLERTLNDAGLRTDANNLHFNLRSESDPRSADGQNGQGGKNGAHADGESAGDDLPSVFDYAAAATARGGVDTFA